MTLRPASSSAPARPLEGASTLARRSPPPAGSLQAVARGKRSPASAPGRLQELERLHVDEILVLADDVRLAHRLEELAGAIELPQADLDAAEALGDVAVGSGTRHDRVLAREAHRLLVEGGERDAGIEDLEDVDLVHDLEQMLVVGDG